MLVKIIGRFDILFPNFTICCSRFGTVIHLQWFRHRRNGNLLAGGCLGDYNGFLSAEEIGDGAGKIFNNGLKSEVQTNEKNEDDTEKNISGKGIGAKPIDGSVTNEQSEKSDSGYYSTPENNRARLGAFFILSGVLKD